MSEEKMHNDQVGKLMLMLANCADNIEASAMVVSRKEAALQEAKDNLCDMHDQHVELVRKLADLAAEKEKNP